MIWLNLGHKTIMKWKYFDQMTNLYILRDYYSWYLRSWNKMILEHSSVHFFIIYKSSSVETNLKCRKMLEFKYVYVARKWKMCSVNYFFSFHFYCNGLLFHSTLNHDGDVCLHPWHIFWMEKTLWVKAKHPLGRCSIKWGAYLHGDHLSSTAEQICSETCWIHQSFHPFSLPLPPIYYTVILAAAWVRRSSEWRLLYFLWTNQLKRRSPFSIGEATDYDIF